MGGIIIEYKTALVFKGPVAKRKEAFTRLKRIRSETPGLKIKSDIDAKAGGMVVRMQFTGSIPQFETLSMKFDNLRASVGIDTVPLPEFQKAGGFPWPKRSAGAIPWLISTRI